MYFDPQTGKLTPSQENHPGMNDTGSDASEVLQTPRVSLISLPPKKEILSPPTTPETDTDNKSALKRTETQLEKARLRQALFLQQRRKDKKRKVLLSRLGAIVKFFVGILLFVGLYYLAISPIWQFRSEAYNVIGSQLIHRDQLAQFVQPLDKNLIYRINPQQIENQIKRFIPLVQDVHVRRHVFPNRLEIMVTEKPVWGVLYHEAPDPENPLGIKPIDELETLVMGKPLKAPPQPMYLLHWDNHLTDLAPYPLSDSLFQQLGEPLKLVSKQSSLKAQTLLCYREVAQLMSSHPKLARFQYLDVSNPVDTYAYFDGFRVRLGRLEKNATARLSRLFDVIPVLAARQDTIDYVDLRWQEQVLLKKKTPAQIQHDRQQAALKTRFEVLMKTRTL